MDTTFPFIQSLYICKVRHLENIEILLDKARPRHLILTGPNGCGKTSVLQQIKTYLQNTQTEKPKNSAKVKPKTSLTHLSMQQDLDSLVNDFNKETNQEKQNQLFKQIEIQRQRNKDDQTHITGPYSLELDLSNTFELFSGHTSGKFIISFFDSKRSSNILSSNGAYRLDLPKISPIDVNQTTPGSLFLQFLVNQQNRAALLQMKGDLAGVAQVLGWLSNIARKFRQLFQNDQLTMEYDIDNFDFIIHMPGREPFRMVDNQLSDGFSAILHVVAELLMRMEAAGNHDYNMPGIVLIDEIETHLHIKLQKAILPFLTEFFPNIQFIVTTHSPFVLTSLPDAVVFDLESHERWENMSPMSASSVVEHYFDLDLYSDTIKHHMTRLQALTGRARSPDEETEYQQLCAQLDNLREEQAPELISHYRALRAKEAAQ